MIGSWCISSEIVLNVIVTGQVNIGSGNGLVPSGNKPLPEPMLTQICCHMASLDHYSFFTTNSTTEHPLTSGLIAVWSSIIPSLFLLQSNKFTAANKTLVESWYKKFRHYLFGLLKIERLTFHSPHLMLKITSYHNDGPFNKNNINVDFHI